MMIDELYEYFHTLIGDVNAAYESGDDERIEKAEAALCNFGSYTDENNCWVFPFMV